MTLSAQRKSRSYHFGDYAFDYSTNQLLHTSSQNETRLEPKVSEDTLARTVSRLRAELNDSANHPQYIETIPKRGYRFIKNVTEQSKNTNQPLTSKQRVSQYTVFATLGIVSLILLIFWFILSGQHKNKNETIDQHLTRADNLYMQFDEQNNEAALALYEKVLVLDPSNARANAGVANAMVQRLVRWPSPQYQVEPSDISLSRALKTGQLDDPNAKLMLERALFLAEKAVRQSPKDVQVIKSLGFVHSANGQLEQAIEQYKKAIALDNTAWRSLINLGELYELNNQQNKSLLTFESAFYAMQEKFAQEPQHIGPWQPALGNVIAEKYIQQGDEEKVQFWSKNVLELVPFERKATNLLVASLLRSGKNTQAKAICDRYAKKLDPIKICP